MQNDVNVERSAAGQQAQTVKVKPKWHMTALHIVYYLIMALFLLLAVMQYRRQDDDEVPLEEIEDAG